ncbi:MAG: hypothetical protein WC389_21015 [Lutibacter sp.]|jgi:ABC-type oligopeptide transport system substrate-binding subunit
MKHINLKKFLLLILILTLLLILTSCTSSGGFDTQGFLKNPLVMAIGVAIVLWFMFRKKN